MANFHTPRGYRHRPGRGHRIQLAPSNNQNTPAPHSEYRSRSNYKRHNYRCRILAEDPARQLLSALVSGGEGVSVGLGVFVAGDLLVDVAVAVGVGVFSASKTMGRYSKAVGVI